MAQRKPRTVLTTWEVWTYDVWGNREDGYDVNDRYCQARDLPIRCKVHTFNVGTEHEFMSASPSDGQLRAIFGVGCQIETDGDDLVIYVTRARDGYPIGELHCSSHEALSPIRVKVEPQPTPQPQPEVLAS